MKCFIMKKYAALILALVCILLITGCGHGTQGAGDGSLPVCGYADMPEELGMLEGADMQEGSVPQGGQDKLADEKEGSIAQGGQQEPPDEKEGKGLGVPEDSSVSGEAVEYSYNDLYLSAIIPEGWDYEVKTAEDMARKDGLVVCAIDFWPEEYPDTVFELGYSSSFGICATGVTIEKFTLPGGLAGCRYTEMIEDTLWLTITLRHPDEDFAHGTYCIDASPKLSVWEAVEEEFEEILDSVEVGPLPEEEVSKLSFSY